MTPFVDHAKRWLIDHWCNALSVITPYDSLNGFDDMRQIVGKTLRIAAHTGRASAITNARNVSGKAFGVTTSTGTPNNLPSS